MCFVFSGNAQVGCGTDALRRQLQEDPSYAAKYNAYREATRIQAAALAQGGRNLRVAGGISTIPVVVHIIAPPGVDANTFVTDQQVLDGISHLNQAFSNSGVYQATGGVNTNIQFCLAQQDGMGNYTTGITRLNHVNSNLPYSQTTSQAEKDIKDAVIAANSSGGIYKYDAHYYLNIYLINDIAGDVAAYAYLPATHGSTYQDGIMSESRYFGVSAENSKVVVHECGHYLGLLHTFEGNCPSGNCPTDAYNTCPVNNQCDVDGDGICDTPPDRSTANYPCNSNINTCSTDVDDLNIRNPFRPVSGGGKGDQQDMIWNHMDYGDLACHTSFTPGQSNWMIATVSGIRASLMSATAIGCTSPCPKPLAVKFTASANPVNLPATISFANTSIGDRTGYSWLWDFGDGTTSTSQTPAAKLYTIDGTYTVKLTATNSDVACKRDTQFVVTAICPLIPGFTVNGNKDAIIKINVGGTITLVSTATGGATLIEWLQDGTLIGTGATLTKTFSSVNGVMISQRISNSSCNRTSDNVFIDVNRCGGSSGQERDNWVFGGGNMLKFNNGTATVSGTATAFAGNYAVSSISDSEGKLLLYSNCEKIYNRDGGEINSVNNMNGYTFGGASQTLLVQHPNKAQSNIYYQFLPNNFLYRNEGYFSYLMVDMNQGSNGLDGKPLGSVVQNQTILSSGPFGGVAAVKVNTATGVNIYVFTFNAITKQLFIYTIDQSGLNLTPKIVDMPLSTISNIANCLKISPDGSMLAITEKADRHLEVYKLDLINETVGDLLFAPTEFVWFGSVEFSPDASKLYMPTGYANSVVASIFQVDLTNNYSIYQVDTQLTISNWSGAGDAQIGPDGKIYVRSDFNYLYIINSPNGLGQLCDFGLQTITTPYDNHTPFPDFVVDLTENHVKIVGSSCVAMNTNGVQFSSSIVPQTGETIKWSVTQTTPALAEITSASGANAMLNFYGAGIVKLKMELLSPCGYQVDEKNIQVGNAASLNLGPDQSNCNGSNVILDAGAGYLNYLWKDATGQTLSTSQVLTTSATGTFSVKVTDNCGSVNTDYITISNGAATATITTLYDEPTILVPTCHPSVTLQSSALTSYTWKKDGTVISGATNATLVVTQVAGQSQGGVYTVTGIDSRGCSASASITVIDALTITGDDQICPGNKASLNVNIAGVTGDYYVQWIQNGGTPTSMPSGDGGDYYALVVLPTFAGCTLTTVAKHVTLKPAPVPYTVSIDKHFICAGDAGATITATAPAYTAVPITSNTWSNGGVTFAGMPATSVLTNVTGSGSYYVTSMGDNGCTAVSNIVSLLTPDVTITQRCTSGGTGTQLIADQSIPNGSYVWKNSAGTVVATTQSFTPSIVGTYTVTSASTNCLATTSTVVCTPPSANVGTNLVTRGDFNITGVASPICTNYAVSSDLTCSDATTTPLNSATWPSNFKITSNAAAENLNKWSGTGFSDPTKPNDVYCLIADGRVTSNDERVWYQQVAVENCATYTFRALIDNIIVNEAEIPRVSLRIKNGSYNSFIKGTTVFANQSNWVELSGTWKSTMTGTVEISIVLDGGGFVGRDIAIDEIYFAKTNCSSLDAFRPGRSCNAVTDVGVSKYICLGQSVQIGNNAGTDPSLTYLWTAPGYSSATANPTVNPTATNTYKLVVTDNVNNCSATDYVTVTIITPEVSITKDLTTSCTASQVKASLFNGVPNVQYEWQVNGVVTATNTTGIFSLTGIATGATVRCRLVTACSSTIYSNTITVGTSAPVSATQSSICAGASTQLHANMSGGTAPYTYTWTASIGAVPAAVAEPIVSPTATTTYSLTFKDVNNCTFTGSVTVAVNALPPLSMGASQNPACEGSAITIGFSYGTNNTLTSFTVPSTVSIYNGTGSQNSTTYFANVVSSGTGNIVGTATSPQGCSTTVAVPFTAYAAPVPMTVTISKNPACVGDAISVDVNYGVGNTLVSFTDPTTINRISGGGGPGAIGFSANVVSAGTGNFTGTATNAQGCSTIVSVPFTVNAVPAPMSVTISKNVACVGDGISATVNYGTGNTFVSLTDPATITRTGAGGLPNGFGFGANVTSAGTGNFVGVSKNAQGCLTTTTVSFTANALPTPMTVTVTPNPVCLGTPITVSVNYGSSNTLVSFTDPSGLISRAGGNSSAGTLGYGANTIAAGTGNFIGISKNAQGCSTTVSIPLTVNALPVSSITSTGTLICSSSPVLLSTDAVGTAYQWYNGATAISGATNTTYNTAAAGTYTMRVTGANTCSNTSAGITLTTSTLAAPRVQVDDATDVYCASVPVAMKVGTALQLNGTTQYVNVPAFNYPSSGTTYGGPITVEFWINAATSANSAAFSIGGLNNTNRAQGHVPHSDGNIYWDYGDYQGNGRIYTSYTAYMGKWTHVALVSAGNGGSYKAIYLNGVKVVSSTAASDGPDQQLNALTIGKWLNFAYFQAGMMDEFRIWNKVLSDAEVQTAMTSLYDTGTPNLMGSWGFDEASGTTVNNDAFSAQTGTIINSATRVYPTTGLTYTWSPSAYLNTSTGTTVIPNTSAVRIYTVKGVDATTGCSAYAQVVTTPNSTCKDAADALVTEPATDWDVEIYPNPTEGDVHISFVNITDDTDLSIEVIGMDGAVIFTIDHVGIKEVCNLRELPGGLYLIRVKYGEQIKTKKVVVVK